MEKKMSKYIRTKHTILVIVTSKGSGGRAQILSGHPCVTDTEKTKGAFLTSSVFKEHEVGALLVVKVTKSGSRRLINDVKEFFETDLAKTPSEDFLTQYMDVLKKESEEYFFKHGLPITTESATTTSEKPAVFQPKPIPVVTAVAENQTPLSKSEAPSGKINSGKVNWANQIFVSTEDRRVLNVMNLLSDKAPQKVMMIGPSGYGKTSIGEQMSKEWEKTFLRWDCGNIRDPEEFFGFRGATDGSTINADGQNIFVKSEFTEVIEKGNCVVVLDEVNRCDPYISNALFPLLDHSAKTNVAGYEIKVGQGVVFIATVNLGHQFTGTFTLDTALTNRFGVKILVGPLPKKLESRILISRCGVSMSQAEEILTIFAELRVLNKKNELAIDASTRTSIQVSSLVGAGLELKQAITYVIVNSLEEEEAKKVADVVSSKLMSEGEKPF